MLTLAHHSRHLGTFEALPRISRQCQSAHDHFSRNQVKNNSPRYATILPEILGSYANFNSPPYASFCISPVSVSRFRTARNRDANSRLKQEGFINLKPHKPATRLPSVCFCFLFFLKV